MRTVFWLTGVILVVSAVATVVLADYVSRYPSSFVGRSVARVATFCASPWLKAKSTSAAPKQAAQANAAQKTKAHKEKTRATTGERVTTPPRELSIISGLGTLEEQPQTQEFTEVNPAGYYGDPYEGVVQANVVETSESVAEEYPAPCPHDYYPHASVCPYSGKSVVDAAQVPEDCPLECDDGQPVETLPYPVEVDDSEYRDLIEAVEQTGGGLLFGVGVNSDAGATADTPEECPAECDDGQPVETLPYPVEVDDCLEQVEEVTQAVHCPTCPGVCEVDVCCDCPCPLGCGLMGKIVEGWVCSAKCCLDSCDEVLAAACCEADCCCDEECTCKEGCGDHCCSCCEKCLCGDECTCGQKTDDACEVDECGQCEIEVFHVIFEEGPDGVERIGVQFQSTTDIQPGDVEYPGDFDIEVQFQSTTDIQPGDVDAQEPANFPVPNTPEQLPMCEEYPSYHQYPGHEMVCPYSGRAYGDCYYRQVDYTQEETTAKEPDDVLVDDSWVSEGHAQDWAAHLAGDDQVQYDNCVEPCDYPEPQDEDQGVIPIYWLNEPDDLDVVECPSRCRQIDECDDDDADDDDGDDDDGDDVEDEGVQPQLTPEPEPDFIYPSPEFPDVDTTEFRPEDYQVYESQIRPLSR